MTIGGDAKLTAATALAAFWVSATAVFTTEAAEAAGLDSRTAIERAVLQIDLGDHALALSYLERPLIDPRITVTERSRAYYLQGYSLQLAGHYVSAAQDYAKALGFNADNPATLAALGDLYARGLGVEKDLPQARELLRRSAQLGHAPGMTRLGALLLDGLSDSATPQQDLEEARAALTGASEANDAEAFLFLAQSYRASHSATPNPQKALEFYKQALLLNESAAFNSIGHMHLNGELAGDDGQRPDRKPNIQKAVEAFTRGAAAQDGPAQVSLGYLYLTGLHVTKDTAKARDLFTQAAAQGETRAHHYLGYLQEVEPNSALTAQQAELAAIEHYKEAAKGDYPPAYERLSELAFANNSPAQGMSYLRAFIKIATPNSPSRNKATHRLAWLLATHPQAALRDGASALQMAKSIVSFERSAATLDTLAAAYAENRDFEAALSTQKEAIQLLEQNSVSPRKNDYAQRLASYETKTPWRE